MADPEECPETGHQPAPLDNTVPISLKILATHLEVGAIIGKHGASITEIQNGSGTKIQISGPNQVFPGTTERIMHLSGEMLKVTSALHMIMQKWKAESIFRDHPDISPEHVQLRIVMLSKLCGAVIGESGKSINEIKLATTSDIKVQSRENCVPGVYERIITITGGVDQVLQAVGRILRKCIEDPAFEEYRGQSLSQSTTSSIVGGMQNLKLPSDDTITQVPSNFVLYLTNEQAGAVLGLKGSNISAIIKMSGAKLSIQSRSEVDDGELRALNISGHLSNANTALGMVVAKLAETSGRSGGGRAGTPAPGGRGSTSG